MASCTNAAVAVPVVQPAQPTHLGSAVSVDDDEWPWVWGEKIVDEEVETESRRRKYHSPYSHSSEASLTPVPFSVVKATPLGFHGGQASEGDRRVVRRVVHRVAPGTFMIDVTDADDGYSPPPETCLATYENKTPPKHRYTVIETGIESIILICFSRTGIRNVQ